MKPGHKWVNTLEDNECVRSSIACILGIKRERIFPIRIETNYWDWERAWDTELEMLGYTKEVFYPDGENEPEGFWVGGVKDLELRMHHAIVMKGKKFWFDPAFQRSQRPHKFVDGWKLIPNVNN